MSVPPIVRYMLICDDVEVEKTTPLRLNIEGLLSTIYVRDVFPFPARVRLLCVLLTLTEGRGRGIGQILCVHEESGQNEFASSRRKIQFPSDPLAITSVVFRLHDCPFREPGMYLFQFWYNGVKLAEQPLRVR
jgi:hypothetical protein